MIGIDLYIRLAISHYIQAVPLPDVTRHLPGPVILLQVLHDLVAAEAAAVLKGADVLPVLIGEVCGEVPLALAVVDEFADLRVLLSCGLGGGKVDARSLCDHADVAVVHERGHGGGAALVRVHGANRTVVLAASAEMLALLTAEVQQFTIGEDVAGVVEIRCIAELLHGLLAPPFRFSQPGLRDRFAFFGALPHAVGPVRCLSQLLFLSL